MSFDGPKNFMSFDGPSISKGPSKDMSTKKLAKIGPKISKISKFKFKDKKGCNESF
jgi:hypothetical protein